MNAFNCIKLNKISINEHGEFVGMPPEQIDMILGVICWLSRQSARVQVWKN